MTHSDSVQSGWTLEELAQLVGGRYKGDASKTVHAIAEIRSATPDSLAHCSDAQHAKYLKQTCAGILILPCNNSWNYEGNQILVDNSRQAFGAVVAEFHQHSQSVDAAGEIHRTAVLDDSAQIADTAILQAHVTVGRSVRIGENVKIGASSVIGDDVTIGDNTTLEPSVTVYRRCRIGHSCTIHAGSVIGASGFSYENVDGKWVPIMNVAAVEIGNHVDIGACCSIDRGSISDTRIRSGVKIDNNVQIGHNCDIGKHTLIVSNVGIGGSVRIGRRCMIAGHVAINSHVEIADGTTILAGSVVTKSLHEAAVYGATIPVRESARWNKTLAKLNRL